MKKGKIFLLGVLIIVVGLFLVKNIIVKSVVEQSVRVVTGLPLHIKSLNLGITSSLIDIKDLQLHNPPGFEEKVMVDIPEIYVDYSLAPLLKGKVDVTDIKLHLKEFIVVKNKDGKVNLDYLKQLQSKKGEDQKEGEKKPQEKKSQDIHIGRLSLKVDRVVYKDYSKGGEPEVNEFNLKIDQTYENIDDLNALISLLVVKSLAQTTVAQFTNIDLSGLSSTLTNTLGSAGELAGETVGKSKEAAKKVFGETKETFKGATEGIKGLFNK